MNVSFPFESVEQEFLLEPSSELVVTDAVEGVVRGGAISGGQRKSKMQRVRLVSPIMAENSRVGI